jgi:alkylation response protein AidB-like acyl-CoA dehydrogenase
VPKANLLHNEGRGLNVALTCLNYGRCTLSAGMLGGGVKAMNQAIKWARTRHQFQRPLAEFELVQEKIARMAALNYAMDAMLYMTTGFLDRHDEDIRVETAICKTFCSEMAWRVVNDAMQIMGGESYMTENEVERIFRDTRITLIVEGANEVMQSFIFGYGGKALAEQMVGIKDIVGPSKEKGPLGNLMMAMSGMLRPGVAGKAIPLGLELFLGIKKAAPRISRLHASLGAHADRLCELIQQHSHMFKVASKDHEEKIIEHQCTQARIGDVAIYLHAMVCVLSKLDKQIRTGEEGAEFERDKAAALHFLDLAELWIRDSWRSIRYNADDSMRRAAAAAIAHNDAMPNSLFSIPERSPTARGTGRSVDQTAIKQFPGEKHTHARA